MEQDEAPRGADTTSDLPHTLLDIAPSVKAPGLDYQWFAVTTALVPRDFPPADGWVPVLRCHMPDEQTSDDEFIQRRPVSPTPL